MAMEILPSIDLRAGRVVRLKQGDYARHFDYDVDPVAARERDEGGAGVKYSQRKIGCRLSMTGRYKVESVQMEATI